jgi:uncharacterized Ntn-hydrolase superfamily protein
VGNSLTTPLGRARTGTYSIVAVDAESGQMGIGVQTHWFNVGALVPWTEVGVGVAATQANVNMAWGLEALGLLGSGLGVEDVVARLVAADPSASSRQLAVADSSGGVANHTGEDCFPYAGGVTGEGWACQANMMATPEVWPAMGEAFQSAQGTLAERMLIALGAGEAAGGDVRGRQSAAIEIVPVRGESWQRLVSLRVEDHPDPLEELGRLLDLHVAYGVAEEGDEALGAGELERASQFYERASALAPGNHELLFWAGLGAAQCGQLALGVERVKRAIELHDGWGEMLERLPVALFPSVGPVREAMATD